MSLNFVLVPGPLVRGSSWAPTAKQLRKSGYNVQIPDVLDNQQQPPAWHAWNSHLLKKITPCQEPILVGHSSASALVADLAHRLPCRCVIIVDGGDIRRTSLVGLDLLAKDPFAFAKFERGLPRLSVDWFDDTIELAGWEHVPAGLIQCSPIYDHATLEARRRGWPTVKLEGTHLHPMLEPAETMRAIVSMSHQLDSAR